MTRSHSERWSSSNLGRRAWRAVRSAGLAIVIATSVVSQAFAARGIETTRPFQPAVPVGEIHTQIHRKLATTVVGISCKAPLAGKVGPQNFFGTGAVISPEGLILTAITVIPEGAREIKVYFVDGRIMAGEVRKFDMESEAVLLKVAGTRLDRMKLADSTACQLGDPVYSWGNPFNTIMKDGMVSLGSGAISGLYNMSSVDWESRYVGPVIESTAALNPGSDGGPLTDADGNLLGLQSLGFSRSRWLGTAIPVHQIFKAMPELKALGTAPRPSLGGARARAWAAERAFPKVTAQAAAATVSIMVVRKGDKTSVPENRQDERLKPLDAYPNDARRNQKELVRPAGAYASGVIVEAEGTVLTSGSMLDDGMSKKTNTIQAIHVFLADGRRIPARLLGLDKSLDLAVLRLEGKSNETFQAATLGDARKLAQGESVAVLGRSEHPGALTLNCGLVSAADRFQGTCSQISAFVNYGNLGGPVVDLHGELAGLAVRLTERTDWRQNCGVGFMLNADIIRGGLANLKKGKSAELPKRPYLGVQGDMGAEDISGGRINRVMPAGAADKAGLKAGDVITEFNGQAIEDWPSLVKAIRATKVGQVVKLKYKRGEEKRATELTIGQME